jgi:hypothetical protein
MYLKTKLVEESERESPEMIKKLRPETDQKRTAGVGLFFSSSAIHCSSNG